MYIYVIQNLIFFQSIFRTLNDATKYMCELIFTLLFIQFKKKIFHVLMRRKARQLRTLLLIVSEIMIYIFLGQN